jgi:hypothetical protein
MIHPIPRFRGWLGLCLAAVLGLAGCDYSAPTTTPSEKTEGSYVTGPGLGPAATGSASAPASGLAPKQVADNPTLQSSDKGVLLENILRLIETAPLKPGGNNFAIATENLNQYFNDTSASRYVLESQARDFLIRQMPEAALAVFRKTSEVAVKDLESRTFGRPDARHIEDCMLYQKIARRVGGVGDDLSRVRRVFRWTMEQVQLVPAGSLGAPGLGQAYARPFDVLMRGMATEVEGVWAERGWIFMVLCRQLGVDVGLLTYTPSGGKEPVIWTCTALIEGKPYLFDTRIGLEIPGPGGDGVATLDDALRDPAVLDRLDLPGQLPYGTTRAALLASASKIGVLLDSSPAYRAPRMALLQGSLAGKNRTILYRDPVDERDQFAQALGAHAGKVALWELPVLVEALLFNNAKFMEASIYALMLFDPTRYPLVYARIKQLRGEIPEAIKEYVTFRFADNPTMIDKKTPLPPEIQQALDVYATYFLALCHLEQGRTDLAEPAFERTLKLLPEPGAGQPYYNMFRWGAQANLGRLCAARGDDARAIAFFSRSDPTTQRHGNLVSARALVWRDPTAPVPPELPPAPAPTTPPPLIAAPPAK